MKLGKSTEIKVVFTLPTAIRIIMKLGNGSQGDKLTMVQVAASLRRLDKLTMAQVAASDGLIHWINQYKEYVIGSITTMFEK